MSDQFSMGRSDQKGREQEAKLKQSVNDGKGSVAGARRSLGRVTDAFRNRAQILLDRAETTFGQLKTLVDQGEYSEAAALVDAFEATNAVALTDMQGRIEAGDLSISMVAVVVQNLRTVRKLTVGL